jgi:two-component system, OmpR family, sensor kinase
LRAAQCTLGPRGCPRARGSAITVDAPEGLAFDADPLRVRQALGDLVDNALRYGAGAVALRARRAATGIELDVCDEGPGFTSDVRDRAFERFSRGDDARDRRGAGLGLAIVQAIADAHNGHAAIIPGAPTTLRIRLPQI